jgi:hypothetical protein
MDTCYANDVANDLVNIVGSNRGGNGADCVGCIPHHAIRIVRGKALPLEPLVPNAETSAATKEAGRSKLLVFDTYLMSTRIFF